MLNCFYPFFTNESLCLRKFTKASLIILIVEAIYGLFLIFFNFFNKKHLIAKEFFCFFLSLIYLKSLSNFFAFACLLIAFFSLQIHNEFHHFFLTI